jgi:two-component system cell cycle sensor histidine kinase/response regulator CckA
MADGARAVLLVEDEYEILGLLSMLFELEGFTVYQAPDGEQALALMEQHLDTIVLLVTDLGLPKLGGVELIERARALKPSIKIIGSSGYGRSNVRDEVLKSGGDVFLPKPFVASELVTTARSLLGDNP